MTDTQADPGGDEVGRKGHPQTWRQRWAVTSLPNRLMVLATIVIALSAVVNLGVAIGQWKVLGRQLDEMAGASNYAERQAILAIGQLNVANRNAQYAQQQAKAAGDQAKAAQNSVKAIQEQMRLDQRAWLGVTHFYVLPPDPHGTIRMRIEVTNTGKTPAISVSYGTVNLVYPKPLLLNPPPDAAAHVVLRPNAPIPPQGATTINVELDVSDLGNNYRAVKDKTKIMYEIGKIQYSDIFGGQHVTRFFEYLNAPDDQFMSTCEGGNSMN